MSCLLLFRSLLLLLVLTIFFEVDGGSSPLIGNALHDRGPRGYTVVNGKNNTMVIQPLSWIVEKFNANMGDLNRTWVLTSFSMNHREMK